LGQQEFLRYLSTSLLRATPAPPSVIPPATGGRSAKPAKVSAYGTLPPAHPLRRQKWLLPDPGNETSDAIEAVTTQVIWETLGPQLARPYITLPTASTIHRQAPRKEPVIRPWASLPVGNSVAHRVRNRGTARVSPWFWARRRTEPGRDDVKVGPAIGPGRCHIAPVAEGQGLEPAGDG